MLVVRTVAHAHAAAAKSRGRLGRIVDSCATGGTVVSCTGSTEISAATRCIASCIAVVIATLSSTASRKWH